MWILIILNKIMSMCTQINLKRTVSMQTVLILDLWGPYAKLSLVRGGGWGGGCRVSLSLLGMLLSTRFFLNQEKSSVAMNRETTDYYNFAKVL